MAAIPNAPGVPPLLTGFDATLSGITAMTADTIGSLGYVQPQWGIFLGGSPVITADTVVSLDYKQEWIIADYPLEQGAFETYDKVALPFDARVRFIAGGSEAVRAALLASVAAIAGDLNLYDVVTPEVVYTSCNVRHYDYQRSSSRGLGMIMVDVWLQWVRVQVGGTSSGNTAAVSGANQVNGGSVQSTAPTSAEASAGAGMN